MPDDTGDKLTELEQKFAVSEREKGEAVARADELRTQIEQLRDSFTNPETLAQLVRATSGTPEVTRTNEGSFDPQEFTSDEGVDVKRLVSFLRTDVSKLVTDELKKQSPQIEALNRKLDMVTAGIQAMHQVSQAKAKFTDFDKYENTMIQISRQLPGATAEQLYYLAKAPDAMKLLSTLEQQKKKETEAGASTAIGETLSAIASEEFKDASGKPLSGSDLTRAIADKLFPGLK